VDLVRLGRRSVAMLVLDIDWTAWVVKMDMRYIPRIEENQHSISLLFPCLPLFFSEDTVYRADYMLYSMMSLSLTYPPVLTTLDLNSMVIALIFLALRTTQYHYVAGIWKTPL